MRKFILPPGLIIFCAMLACNAPTPPPASPHVEPSTPISTAPVTEAPTSRPSFDLPDIAGTANAQASATLDPNQRAQIRGAIRYPSGGNPAMRIYALAVSGQAFQFVSTGVNQGSYEVSVPSGEYYILAAIEDNSRFEAGYTAVGQCLAQNELRPDACPNQDHSLVAIHIQAGQTLEHIDLIDWFPPDGTFLPVP